MTSGAFPLDVSCPFRLRTDLRWTLIEGQRRPWWVAFDPLRNKHYRCGDAEYRLLHALDGQRSINQLCSLLGSDQASPTASPEWIAEAIRSSRRKQLLVSNHRTANEEHLAWRLLLPSGFASSESAQWLRWLQQLPWALVQGRLQFGPPPAFFQGMARRTSFLYSSKAVSLWLLFIILTAMIVLVEFATQSRWGAWNQAAISSNWLSYLIILLATRVAHELGHALVCLRMGAQCRDMGLFFMMGVACPYVDVTDAWHLKQRRGRMAVTAAGIYTELIIASIAGWLWYLTDHGWVHAIAGQIMIVCSVTTLAINANPLMRYDGYYLLTDWLELVHLREAADRALVDLWREGFASRRRSGPEREGGSIGLAAYAILSRIYRSTLIVAMVWAFYLIATQWSAPKIGIAFAILTLVSFILIPTGRSMLQSWKMARHTRAGAFRWMAGWMGGGCLMLYACFVPLPYRIACQGRIEPDPTTVVYTTTAGSLASSFSRLAESDRRIVLENPHLTDQLYVARRHQHELEGELAQLRRGAYSQPSLIDRQPTMKTLVEIARLRTRRASDELQRLTIEPSNSGRWIPVGLPLAKGVEGNQENVIPPTIDDASVRGRWLAAGTPIGLLTNTDRIFIAAESSAARVDDLQQGMAARICLDQYPGRIFQGKLVRVSEHTAFPQPVTSLAPDEEPHSRLDEEEGRILLFVEVTDLSLDEVALDGSAQVVLWGRPRSLFQHARELVATFR